MNATLQNYLDIHSFRHFKLRTLCIDSEALKGNPLGDPSLRRHPILVPNKPPPKDGYPVVFVLAGFTGNGPSHFNVKALEPNLTEVLDRCRAKDEAPDAIFVFIDAMTRWGGSQFVNSEGTGRYEDHVALEVPQALQAALPVAKTAGQWCVTGGSSGGYGALHLSSKFPDRFGVCAALAPDSFFEASLLTEIWTSMPVIRKLGGVDGVRAELEAGKLKNHTVLNAVAMGVCYAPAGTGVDWPIDELTGVLRTDVWKRWKAHDPLEFIKVRQQNVTKLSRVLLDCGTRDQFHLQYGSRQIRDILVEMGIQVEYTEFEGGHFDLGERRPLVWKWLKSVFESERKDV